MDQKNIVVTNADFTCKIQTETKSSLLTSGRTASEQMSFVIKNKQTK